MFNFKFCIPPKKLSKKAKFKTKIIKQEVSKAFNRLQAVLKIHRKTSPILLNNTNLKRITNE